MPDLALVHLVRKANGPEPFLDFLASYRAVDAGADHDLVLLLKGFDGERDAAETAELAGGAEARRIHVGDDGFDLGAYFAASGRLDHPRVCFVNSFTTARAPGWLGALADAHARDGVGLAGTTASYASHWSWIRYNLRLPSPYARVFGSRAQAQEQMAKLIRSRGLLDLLPLGLRHWVGTALLAPIFVRRFAAFPSPHVRTNGFLLDTDLLRSLERPRIRRKVDAFVVESGTRSLTRQIEARGLRAVVAGADGRAYEVDEWAASRTFWQRAQENALLDDNQTRAYADADSGVRAFLSRFAWGEEADPG